MDTQELTPHAEPTLASRIPEWSLRRATGASRVDGNALRLQFDGPSTFDAWIEAIDRAREYVHFENYALRDDRVGRVFRDALVQKARAGVQVRVLYDWVGCWATLPRYWKPFREAGVEVQAFNPPSIRDPFGLLQRDHRKLVCVDGLAHAEAARMLGISQQSLSARLGRAVKYAVRLRGSAIISPRDRRERHASQAGQGPLHQRRSAG